MRTLIFSIALQAPFSTYPLGSPGSPADNRWIGSFTNSHTFTLNTQNVNIHSPMYVRAGTSYNPSVNLTNTGVPSNAYLPVLTTGPMLICQMIQNLPGGGNPNIAFMEQIVQDAVPYPVFPAETGWQNKAKVFKQLKDTPQLMNNSPILQSFYTAALSSSMQAFDSADASLQVYNLAQAAWQNASVSPQVQPEYTKQDVNTVYIDYLQYGLNSIDSSDIALLSNTAHACHTEQGDALFTARTLYNYLFNDAHVFNDSCTYNNNARVFQSDKDKNNPEERQVFKIYPNPNNGEMTLYYELPEKEHAEVVIYDVFGKLVYKTILDAKKIMHSIELKNKAMGMYYYKILQADKIMHTGKFIITH